MKLGKLGIEELQRLAELRRLDQENLVPAGKSVQRAAITRGAGKTVANGRPKRKRIGQRT